MRWIAHTPAIIALLLACACSVKPSRPPSCEGPYSPVNPPERYVPTAATRS
ncbi:hypothetical protein EC912_103245 [Luteibacter rhizovicinus]|uniref:Lipoprotein n=1 Tax=Luteibacter rhizovicinus TaxID=242606 RepID=A0A4R3YQQ9_9GAMM|nr:hypothetical protein EC912_103245 [Luteibacter rhizovicinus]